MDPIELMKRTRAALATVQKTKGVPVSIIKAKAAPVKATAKKVRAKTLKNSEGKPLCRMCKQAAPRKPKGAFCAPCYKIRRTKQLADNNKVWVKRVKAGRAGHHLTYKGKLTEWAGEHKQTALPVAKKMALKEDKPHVASLGKKALHLLTR